MDRIKKSVTQGLYQIYSALVEIVDIPAITGNVIAFVFVAVLVLVSGLVFPRLSEHAIQVVAALLALLFLIAVVYKKRRMVLGTAILALVVLSAGLLFKPVPERGVTYLIVDASEEMSSYYDGIGPRIKLSARAAPDGTKVGLMVFGAAVTGYLGCDDIAELVAPTEKSVAVPEIDKAADNLAKFPPGGPGTLELALHAAFDHLEGFSGVQKIVVITNGADSSCGRLDRALLYEAASRRRLEYELSIITIGPQNINDEQVLSQLAHYYSNVPGLEQIGEEVQQVVAQPIRDYYSPFSDQ